MCCNEWYIFNKSSLIHLCRSRKVENYLMPSIFRSGSKIKQCHLSIVEYRLQAYNKWPFSCSALYRMKGWAVFFNLCARCVRLESLRSFPEISRLITPNYSFYWSIARSPTHLTRVVLWTAQLASVCHFASAVIRVSAQWPERLKLTSM